MVRLVDILGRRHNVLGAYNAITKKLLSVVNDSYINFDDGLRDVAIVRRTHVGDSLTIVLDNTAYQRCKLAKNHTEELNITLVLLPSDSPNLNLIERPWKFVRKPSLNNVYYETFEDVKSGINACLKNIDKKDKLQVASLMTLKFQTFEKTGLWQSKVSFKRKERERRRGNRKCEDMKNFTQKTECADDNADHHEIASRKRAQKCHRNLNIS